MITADAGLPPAAVKSLGLWHEMVKNQDVSGLPEIVADDAVFRSPTVLHPFESRKALVTALETVLTVFEDFTYHREFAGTDGQSVVLEFSAKVGDKSLKGIDIIRFDESGRIADFEVMVRPLNALQDLYDAMIAKLGKTLVTYKNIG